MISRILTLLLFFPLGALAQSAAKNPMTLRARDAHQDLLIAADPFVPVNRYKETFGKTSPYTAGIIAIDVFFRNDNSTPIRLNLNAIRLVISLPEVERQRLEPLSPEEVADRTILNADANPKPRRPFPFPDYSGGHKKSKAWNEMDTMLRSVSIPTDILPPHATMHGLLFFDMNYNFDAIWHTHLYIPDLSFMTDHTALFFFEIDLGQARMK